MHLTLLFVGLLGAWGLRLLQVRLNGTCQQRWQRSLSLFLVPPLLLLTTSIALVCMGPQGQMVRLFVYVLGLILGSLLMIGLYAVILYALKAKPVHFFRSLLPALSLAFGTASSNAALP